MLPLLLLLLVVIFDEELITVEARFQSSTTGNGKATTIRGNNSAPLLLLSEQELAERYTRRKNDKMKLTLAPGLTTTANNFFVNGSGTVKQKKLTQFFNQLFDGYDKRLMPPNAKRGGVVVEASLFVNSLDSISEISFDYDLGIFLRLMWRDSRLVYNASDVDGQTFITLDASVYDALWVPDLKVANEKSARFHDVPTPNRLIHLTSNGDILYSSRLYLTLNCQMELHTFPFDNQECRFVLESYAYRSDQIVLRWTERPLEMRDLVIPQFSLSSVKFEMTQRKTPLGNNSMLLVSFHMFRDFGFYMLQIYLPSFLTVFIAFTAFWIDPLAVPGRTTIGVFTTLLMGNMSFGLRDVVPRVSYIKAVDVWVLACTIFVFLSLLEYALINVLLRQKSYRNMLTEVILNSTQASVITTRVVADIVETENAENIQISNQENTTSSEQSAMSRRMRLEHSTKSLEKRLQTLTEQARVSVQRQQNSALAHRLRRVLAPHLNTDQTFQGLSGIERCELVEATCRYLFPFCFAIFNVIYWFYYCYLLQSDYDHGDEEEHE